MLNIIRERLNGTTRELARLVKAYVDADKFVGSVLVAVDGEIALRQAVGWANREFHADNTPTTAYRIGSMTKAFTALAVMRLAEQGALSVNDPLAAHLPDYPNASAITLHHLLSNTSGIPDYIVMPRYTPIMRSEVAYDDLLALFRDEPLLFTPGTNFSYSNGNWILLGMIIEQVTGKRYADAVRDLIFAPAGMTRSGYAWELPLIPQRATGYVDTGDGVYNALVVHETTMDAAGALYSTVDDLFKWDQALRAGAIVTPQSWAQMTKPVFPGYGCGWELYKLHDQPVVGHSGGLPGFVANFAQIGSATIILLSNIGSAALSDLTRDLAAVLLDAPYALPVKQTFITLDPSALVPYLGEFRIEYYGRVSTLKFVVEGDKLIMYIVGLPKSVLSPLSANRFYGRSKGDVEITFVKEADGSVQRIDLRWAGQEITGTRIA
jgi:CubicO group peptidase (beta-lactamase class C family)